MKTFKHCVWLKDGKMTAALETGSVLTTIICTRPQVTAVRKSGKYISACMGRTEDDLYPSEAPKFTEAMLP